MFLMGGNFVRLDNVSMRLNSTQLTGVVKDRGNGMPGTSESWFTTTAKLPANGALAGHQVRFCTSTEYADGLGPRDTWFEIKEVTVDVNGIAHVTLDAPRLTSGYIDPDDPEKQRLQFEFLRVRNGELVRICGNDRPKASLHEPYNGNRAVRRSASSPCKERQR